MGGLAGLFEEHREFLIDNGGDDPSLTWRSVTNNGLHKIYVYPTTYHHHASHISGQPIYQIEYSHNSQKQEVAFYNSLLSLCEMQTNGLLSFAERKLPRSKAFSFWLNVMTDNVEKRKVILKSYLNNQARTNTSKKINFSANEFHVKSRLLEYIIRRIFDEDIKLQLIDRTELINIIDDATVYISYVNHSELIRDTTNSVFVDYVKKHFNLKVRDDYCCSHCDGNLYIGVPYCLSCIAVLSR